MEKCLVTKLNGRVKNDELLRLGEMRMKIKKVTDYTSSTHGFLLGISKPVTLEIIGDGYFTDNELSANNGKSITLNGTSSFWVSNNDVEVAILDKYSITHFKSFYGYNLYLDIESFKYSSNLTTLELNGARIIGDISALKNLTELTTLNLPNSKVSGDISALKNLTELTILNIDNYETPLTGDIGTLSTLTKCTEIGLRYSVVTGDLATLPASCRFVSFAGDTSPILTWGTRNSSSKILAIEGHATLTNVDKMLQDQANCQIGFTSSDSIYYKTISVVGTRTSASDAAVQALQNKGYTISIIPA